LFSTSLPHRISFTLFRDAMHVPLACPSSTYPALQHAPFSFDGDHLYYSSWALHYRGGLSHFVHPPAAANINLARGRVGDGIFPAHILCALPRTSAGRAFLRYHAVFRISACSDAPCGRYIVHSFWCLLLLLKFFI